MRRVQSVHASPRYGRAVAAVTDLLTRLKLDFAFVGNVARSAWLGSRVERGPLDLIALMTPEQKNNVAMMANNRGFRVDRDEIAQSEELDLVPLNFADPEGEIRVHVLVGSNALYGRMVKAAVAVILDDTSFRVAAAEDLALLLALGEDDDSRRGAEMLIRLPGFDRAAYNGRLVSIGLPQLVVNE
jgi:hypothetical protein